MAATAKTVWLAREDSIRVSVYVDKSDYPKGAWGGAGSKLKRRKSA